MKRLVDTKSKISGNCFSSYLKYNLITGMLDVYVWGIISLIEFPIYRKYNKCSDTAGEYNCTPGECAWEVFSQNGRKTSDASTKKWGNSIKYIIPYV